MEVKRSGVISFYLCVSVAAQQRDGSLGHRASLMPAQCGLLEARPVKSASGHDSQSDSVLAQPPAALFEDTKAKLARALLHLPEQLVAAVLYQVCHRTQTQLAAKSSSVLAQACRLLL